MKTTIDIADALLEEARQAAEASRTTLRALVEAGLRQRSSAGRNGPRILCLT
jgi:Bacterial antitoxin of type II TA system, VapB